MLLQGLTVRVFGVACEDISVVAMVVASGCLALLAAVSEEESSDVRRLQHAMRFCGSIRRVDPILITSYLAVAHRCCTWIFLGLHCVQYAGPTSYPSHGNHHVAP